MPAGYAFIPPRSPGPGKTGVSSPAHAMDTRHPIMEAGDPYNLRNIVHESDFASEGKPWASPGVHVNLYSNVRSTQAIMSRFFGGVSKLRFLRQPNRIPRGRQTVFGEDVNLERAPAVAYGDFATYTAQQRIPTGA